MTHQIGSTTLPLTTLHFRPSCIFYMLLQYNWRKCACLQPSFTRCLLVFRWHTILCGLFFQLNSSSISFFVCSKQFFTSYHMEKRDMQYQNSRGLSHVVVSTKPMPPVPYTCLLDFIRMWPL